MVVDLRIVALFATRARREAVDAPLIYEGHIRAHPWLALVHMLERILLHVLPLHVLLLVGDGIPPDVEQAIRVFASSHKERSEAETAAVLGDNEVDGFGLAVTDG